ncbi:rod shape-determining protein MreC [Ekhidna sp.]|uniref:rod shape-determining protein MreC n=1 Tax=Ekhidna sp. TaxID=2608089 RepID=UPI003B59F419
MQRLLDFLYQQREIAVFLGLEILSAWLLINYNNRYNASFLNSSNEAAASLARTSNNVSDYFQLTEVNERLMLENEKLQQELRVLRTEKSSFLDTVNQYRVIGAKVINNTFDRSTNFVTISAGRKDSVEVGMGVISSFGVVGQVKSVTQNFATIYSLLHPKLLVSSKVKRTDTKCTVQWDQEAYDRASLKYIPRHIKLKKGDSIVTSGFNSVFPENILVGVVDDLNLEEHMTFYEAKVKLATDFTSLYQVFVIKDLFKEEKDSLQLQ